MSINMTYTWNYPHIKKQFSYAHDLKQNMIGDTYIKKIPHGHLDWDL